MADLQKNTPYYEAFRRAKPLSFVDYEKFETMLSGIIEIINLIAIEEKIKDFNKISDTLKSLQSANKISDIVKYVDSERKYNLKIT
jgi:hypothetical protein